MPGRKFFNFQYAVHTVCFQLQPVAFYCHWKHSKPPSVAPVIRPKHSLFLLFCSISPLVLFPDQRSPFRVQVMSVKCVLFRLLILKIGCRIRMSLTRNSQTCGAKPTVSARQSAMKCRKTGWLRGTHPDRKSEVQWRTHGGHLAGSRGAPIPLYCNCASVSNLFGCSWLLGPMGKLASFPLAPSSSFADSRVWALMIYESPQPKQPETSEWPDWFATKCTESVSRESFITLHLIKMAPANGSWTHSL